MDRFFSCSRIGHMGVAYPRTPRYALEVVTGEAFEGGALDALLLAKVDSVR